MLHVSDQAQQYFIRLLGQQKQGTQIRIFLKNSDTSCPEYGICYYFPEHDILNDIIIKLNSFSIYINQTIAPLIKGTKIDLISNALGTYISIHSPKINILKNNNLKNKQNKPSLENQIKHILDSQINPKLSMHGGKVSLVRITQDFLVVLQFYGGCNGCAMAYYTVKEGIEKTLKQLFPEVKGVIDATQHKHGIHSYY